jgi:hypothetical protein
MTQLQDKAGSENSLASQLTDQLLSLHLPNLVGWEEGGRWQHSSEFNELIRIVFLNSIFLFYYHWKNGMK